MWMYRGGRRDKGDLVVLVPLLFVIRALLSSWERPGLVPATVATAASAAALVDGIAAETW
jgi:hypothetical protein